MSAKQKSSTNQLPQFVQCLAIIMGKLASPSPDEMDDILNQIEEIIAFAVGRLNEIYLKVQRVEVVARKVTGLALVVIGIYNMLKYTVGI